MKEPHDHLGKGAVQREAEPAEPVRIDYLGVAIELPADAEDWPLEALEALEDGHGLKWARAVLTERSYVALKKAIRAATGKPPTMRDLTPLIEQVAEIYGFDTSGN